MTVNSRDRSQAAQAIAAGDRRGTASGLIASVAYAIAFERERVLDEARAFIAEECSSYPQAPVSITSGIFGAFDQWAAAMIDGPCTCPDPEIAARSPLGHVRACRRSA